MATQRSPGEDDSRFEGDAWRDIVALAARLDHDAVSGRAVDDGAAMELARSILSLEDDPFASQARLRAKAIR
jgi:hypothetical protein